MHRFLAATAAFLSLLGFAPASFAQVQPLPVVEPPGIVHFSYSALFGTGVYQVEDRTVAVVRVPISWELREPTREKPGIRFSAPITFGIDQFDLDSIIGILVEDQFASVSVLPGVTFSYPVRSNWMVDVSGHLGAGRDMTANENSMIYGARAGTRYTIENPVYPVNLGADILFAGHSPEDAKSRGITRFGIGADMKIPLNGTSNGSPLFLNPQLVAYYYSREVEFLSPVDDLQTLRAEYQVGLALGRERPVKLLGLEFDRIGIAYRFSKDLEAIKLFVGFPF